MAADASAPPPRSVLAEQLTADRPGPELVGVDVDVVVAGRADRARQSTVVRRYAPEPLAAGAR